MTSQGNAYARFRRALERGNVTATLAAAAELRQLGLTDALEVCLVLRSDPPRFERAIVWWHARYIAERRDLGFAESAAVLALLAALAGPRGDVAARSLARVARRPNAPPGGRAANPAGREGAVGLAASLPRGVRRPFPPARTFDQACWVRPCAERA